MLNVCDYQSVQDHYGSSSNVKYATDDILNGDKLYKKNSNENKKVNSIYSKLDIKINSLFKKLKDNSTNVGYKKKLIILIGKINKIKGKYKNNEIILVLINYIDQKIREEILKIN